ncbi:hypothetical protein tb265_26060 [Gemmatimonadetes bacterium T265]|nr:hypothetical protein tb265_26060 [Gemmatimonadetes bacterium T265]
MPASRRRSARRARGGVVAAGATAVLLVAAHARGRAAGARTGAWAADAAPVAEFLAVAGDSTYWVTSGPGGVHVRSAPLFLTRAGGRLTDVYVVDDGVRFEGAEFSTVRVYRRDLLRGDSALVVGDDEVPGMAVRYAAAHPGARALDDDEDAESEPALVAEHAVGLVAVHGPFVTLDLRTTVDGPDAAHREDLRRHVLDLRSGRPASLAALGAADPDALVAAGRRAFAAAVATLDTLRPAPADDSAGTRARTALASLRFDPDNFGLVAVGGAPAVQFVARGSDTDGAVTLALAPVPLRAAGSADAEPAWWTADVRPLLPTAAPDATRLLARVLGGAPDARAESLVRLDQPPADPALRRALRRAFDESTLAGDAVTTSVALRRHW